MERELHAQLEDAKDARERRRVWRAAALDMLVAAGREHWDLWVGTDEGRWTMREVTGHLRRALRSLRRSPGFSVVVVLTVALGVGAATTIYSVVYGVLLAPLPYPDADRIVTLNEAFGPDRTPVSVGYLNVEDWKAEQATLEDIALVLGAGLTLRTDEGAEQVSVLMVDSEYFDILDVRPVLGRVFGPEDNRVPGGHPVAVLAHETWQQRFGGDPGIVGSGVNLGGVPYTILGVLPADHRQPFVGADGAESDFFVPTMMVGQVDPRGDAILRSRAFRPFGAFGKLRPGVDFEAAEADLDAIAARVAEANPGTNRGFGAVVRDLRETQTQGVQGPVLTLLAGALVLVLIACFNVANLMLVRGAGREQELALQLALGSGRSRLFKLLTMESLVLAVAGGILGTLGAQSLLPWVLELLPTQLPPNTEVRISLPVLGGSAALSLAAGLLFGLLPAARLSGVDLRDSLSGVGRSVGDRAGDRIRNGLIVFEVATATVLLASSALLVRAFQEIRTADSGFVTENVLSMRVTLPAETYPDSASLGRGVEAVTARVSELPGVEWAHVWGPGRPGLVFSFQTTLPDGMVVEELSDSPLARRHHIAPGALEDMDIPLLRGRGILDSDVLGEPIVAVVGESLARELWPGEDALGQRFHGYRAPGAEVSESEKWTVVGVVADAKHGGRDPVPGGIRTNNDVYFSIAQRPERAFTLLVRGTRTPEIGPIREAVAAVDPSIPVFQVRTMAENFAQEEGNARFAAQLMAGFGLFALLLTALGVYGVVSFAVAQRTREIGLRAALGAESSVTLGLFLRRGLVLAGSGVLLGTLASYGLAASVRSVIADLPRMEPFAIVVAGVGLLLIASLASLVPAHRATRIDPVVALKGE